jgi:DEAD/DEAH box helicase domain-containing protein
VKLFENLKYVVIDELHMNRGVYGSHVGNVLRRLQRLCRFYGSDPQFLCSSATIKSWEEPVVNRQLGIRKSALRSARDISAKFLEKGLQTIVFAPSRLATEVCLPTLPAGARPRTRSRSRSRQTPFVRTGKFTRVQP